jgi:hypothetical protein
MAKTAERVLLAQAALVGGLAVALFIRELPGLVREIRIFRMVCPRAGAHHPG